MNETDTALPTPAQYLANIASTAQIVLLGDQPGISAHLKFLSEAIPVLAAADVQNLAWDYTNTRRQSELDELTTAREWDERACVDLFADLLGIGFAYREYADVLHAVWAHNSEASNEARQIRMVALGLPTYVEDPDLLDGRSGSELELRNWWMGGHYRDIAAIHASNVLTEQVLRKGERAVVYSDIRRTTTRLVEWSDDLATVTMGNLLHHWLGDGVKRVLFHGAVGDPAATKRVEELVSASPESGRQGAQATFGLDLATSTIGNVGLTKVSGAISSKTGALRLRDVADGYLYLSAREDWQRVLLLENFVNDSNFASIEARYRALVPRSQQYSKAELEQVRIEGFEQLKQDWPPLLDEEEPPKRRFRFGPKLGKT